MEFGGLSIISMIMEIMYQYGMQQWAYQESDLNREDQQAFQAEREDIAYDRNINFKADQYQQYLDLGINPNLAADSILGGNHSSPASALGAPSYPSPLSTMGSLSQLFGNMQDTVMNSEKRAAEVENLRADSNKKNVEAGLMPRDYQLRVMSTDAQIRLWNETADKICKEAKLTEQQTELVKQQNMYYGRLTQAEIDSYKAKIAEAYAQANLAMEQLRTEEKKRDVMDSEIAVNYSEVAVNRAVEDKTYNESYNVEVRTAREKICRDFEIALGGIPLTVDAQKYVQKLAKDGDLDGINNFYQTIFATSLNQSVGSEYGKAPQFGLPFGIFNSGPIYRGRDQQYWRDRYNKHRVYFTPDYLR